MLNVMGDKTPLQKLPSRIKYYLLEWKDSNMDEYMKKFGPVGLNTLDHKQLCGLFYYATTKDNELIK